jgi:inorganic pyrophosphatase
MSTSLLIKQTEHFEVDKFKRPKNIKHLNLTHIAFSGSPRKNPHDAFRIILVADPYSGNTFYYEFNIEDIAYVEELPKLVSPEEEIIPMVRVWVRKGSIAVRSTPFVVDNTLR